MAFESVTTNAGSGGATLAVSTFTDTDAVSRTLPFSGLAFGAIDAIPTPVTTSDGLPVAQQGTWTVSVTGVATAANQATGNASLASIDGKITACNTGAVVVSSSALPSGAATAAKQPALGTAGTASTDVITVQGIASMTALKVDGSAVTQPISVASLPSHDVTNAGTFAVQVSSALPAGTNAIGKLAANSGIDIGDVDVTSVIPGTGATNLGKAIDTATGSTDTGVLTLATRDDALSTLTPAEGDNVQLRVDANGALWVVPSGSVAVTGTFWQATQPVSLASVPSHNVTNAGTFAVQAAQSGTWTVTGTGGTFPVTDSGGSLTVDAPVATPVFVRLSDGASAISTLPVSLASVPSHDVTNAGTFAVQATVAASATNIAKAEDAASANADVGVPAMAVQKASPANTAGTDGDYEMLQMSAGRLWTSATIDAALPAGTNAIGKLASNTGVTIGAVEIAAAQTLATVTTLTGTTSLTPGTAAANLGKAEDAAHGSGDVGVMALAVRSNTAASTSGSDGDYQPLITNTTGHLWVDASGQTLTVGSHDVTNAGTFAVQATIQAGTALVGKVSSSAETSTIYDGTTALTPKFAAISASSSGNNTLVAAVVSKKIRVLAYNFIGNGAVNAKFQSGAGGTDLTGLKYIAAAGGGICASFNPAGWFETASNTLLNLNLSGAVAVGGELVYVEV